MNTIGLMLPMGNDFVDGEFCHDFALALAYHAAMSEDQVNLHFRQGTIMAEQRQELLKIAVDNGATHAIFLDTDMRFPKDVIERMVAHDVPVVAANCAKRRRPISATARVEDPDDPSKLIAVWPDKNVTGLQQIAVVGTAVMCIKTEILTRLEYPWFDQPFMHDQDSFVGEDLFFAGRLKQAGVPLYIDHDLSWEIKHIGKYEYDLDDVLAERQLAEAGKWDHINPHYQRDVDREVA